MTWSYQLEGEILKELGEKIRAMRRKAGISQQQLADEIGFSRISISEIERGQNTSVTTLIRILKVFGKADEFEALFNIPEISPKALFEQQQKKRK